MGRRLDYRARCERLQQLGGLEPGPIPPLPSRMPREDDPAPLGVRFFRTLVSDAELDHLTLPRTFFGRTEVRRCSFRETDLSESRFCWNEFSLCDFSGADLSGADMRASGFIACRFVGADLRGADLRRSQFEGCDFSGADLSGAIADDETGESGGLLDYLSDEQRARLLMLDDPGPEPEGG